jgi:hypothetical protein
MSAYRFRPKRNKKLVLTHADHAVECDLRKGGEVTRYLTGGRRKPGKPDLAKLAAQELFAYLMKHYVGD